MNGGPPKCTPVEDFSMPFHLNVLLNGASSIGLGNLIHIIGSTISNPSSFQKEGTLMMNTLRTMQEIFDISSVHLLRQKKMSTLINPTSHNPFCAYRGENGLTCALGCLISDEDYRPEMEGRGVSVPIVYEALHTDCDESFLMDLQGCHDDYEPEEWWAKLHEIATRWELSTLTMEEQCSPR